MSFSSHNVLQDGTIRMERLQNFVPFNEISAAVQLNEIQSILQTLKRLSFSISEWLTLC